MQCSIGHISSWKMLLLFPAEEINLCIFVYLVAGLIDCLVFVGLDRG